MIMKHMDKEKNVFLPRNKKLKGISSSLRKNATPEENKLWYEFLRTYSVRVNRQRIIGDYIADFYCSKAKLIIEIDGSQHFYEKSAVKDKIRTEFFESLGIKVIRFQNDEINQCFYEVCTRIDEEIKQRVNSLIGSF